MKVSIWTDVSKIHLESAVQEHGFPAGVNADQSQAISVVLVTGLGRKLASNTLSRLR